MEVEQKVEQNYDWLYDFHVFFTDHMMEVE